MGLDMYLYATKTLSSFKKKEKLYIDYLNTLNEPDVDTAGGLFISKYFDYGIAIHDVLSNQLPKLDGQVGDITMVTRINGEWQITTESMYWRKANQLHSWFVKNCQGSIDDCANYIINIDSLLSLNNDIKLILYGTKFPDDFENSMTWQAGKKSCKLAHDLLPTQNGFFFGGTDYNRHYFWDLKTTRETLRSILKKATYSNWVFSYHSSW